MGREAYIDQNARPEHSYNAEFQKLKQQYSKKFKQLAY